MNMDMDLRKQVEDYSDLRLQLINELLAKMPSERLVELKRECDLLRYAVEAVQENLTLRLQLVELETLPKVVGVTKRLPDDVEFLKERVRQLEDIIANPLDENIARVFTGQQSVILRALLTREASTIDQLHTLLYGGRANTDVPDARIIDVHICRIRGKLKPYDVMIDTLWGQGYSMSKDNKEKFRNAFRLIGNGDGG